MCTVNLDNMPSGEGPNIEEDGCSTTTNIPYDIAQQSILHYATARFNVLLRNSPESQQYLVDIPTPPFDPVTLYAGSALPDWPSGCGGW